MKIEMHLHTKLGSGCGSLSPLEIINLYRKESYDALIITEHYSEAVFENFYESHETDKKERFLQSYYNLTKESGGSIKIFLGAEVCLTAGGIYADYLVYGLTPTLIEKLPYLYALTQKQLYELCEKNGLFLAQAHPFRNYVTLGSPLYMHGVEVFNNNARHKNYNDTAEEFSKNNNLIGICGSDFHQTEDIGGGIITKKDIETNSQLISCLKNKEFTRIY